MTITETAPTLKLVFVEADIPTTKRATAPNPYLEAVQAIVGKEKSMTVTLPTTDEKLVKTALGLITRCGQLIDPPVSVRKTIVKDGQTTRVTFWTRALIVHKKPEQGDGPAPTVEPQPAVKAVPKGK